MATRLKWTSGTDQSIKRAAALLAIKVKDDVLYEFNGTEYTITLIEARELLPELIAETLKELEGFKHSCNQHLDYLQKALTEVMEATSQL